MFFRYLKWVFHGILFRFLVCQIWSFEVAHVSPYFSCAYKKIWTNFMESIESFKESTIAHLKYIFFISNGYFSELYFVLWFERYHQLKQLMFVKQSMHVSWDSTNIFSLSGPPQSKYVIWMERSFWYLKWFFDVIQFHRSQQKLWMDLWQDIDCPQFSNLIFLWNPIVIFFPCKTPYIKRIFFISNTVMGQPH